MRTVLFSEEAIQEATVNLIVHRDYTMQVPATIHIYNNKVVFTNPGSSRYNIKDFLEQEPPPLRQYERNVPIIEAFSRTGLNQRRRGGLKRIRRELIRNGSARNKHGEPFEIDNDQQYNTFSITMFRTTLKMSGENERLEQSDISDIDWSERGSKGN